MKNYKIRASVLFSVIYGIALFALSPFLISWGSSRSWWEKVLIFFLEFPFDWAKLIADKSIVFLFLNIVFWGVVFYAILVASEYIRRLIK